MTATVQDLKPGDRVFLPPRVPQGLAAAVEGLTREVIRHRPENIYVFAARHFENLLHLREQYDPVGQTNKKSMKILHDMNEAIKERHVDAEQKRMNNYRQSSGWSLNETAKVLEKHRSIFGETGQKISTEEVRELAKEPLLTSPKIQDSGLKKKSDKSGVSSKNIASKYAASSSTKKKESPRVDSQDSGNNKSDSRSAPKIISQIPLTKDIKTELKKNRISSKERKKIEEKKMQVACEYTRETTVEKTTRRSVEKTKRTYESRSEHRKVSRTEDSTSCTKKKTEITKDKVDSPKIKRPSRSMSMDGVKKYVVQNVAGMSSLDELHSPSYVQKVQEVIDESSGVIKDKVEALKTGAMKAAKKQSKKERSTSDDEHSKGSSHSPDSNRKSQEDIPQETTSARNLSKSSPLSKAGQNNVENLKLADDYEQSVDQPESKIPQNSDSSNESKISLPAVRPPSSKSTSRSLSARSDSDGLILPPISPESTKSPKVKEELVLPVLSPPRSTAETPEVSVSSTHSNGKPVQKNQANNDEEFQDSLNVTPDLLDAPQRPDSLETSEIIGDRSDSSGHVSPLDTLKDKLLEIEQVQKRIENVLDDTATKDAEIPVKKEDEPVAPSRIEDKLVEIQESEKRIEKILDSQTTSTTEVEATNVNIKSKLQELEAAEKRIENIFDNETGKETTNKPDSASKNVKQQDETSPHTNTENTNGKSTKKEVEKTTNGSARSNANGKDSEKYVSIPAETSGMISPHSYILTEGSPHEIPDSVTTVIIPDRIPTPDSDTLRDELENGAVYSSMIPSTEINTLQVESSEALHKEQTVGSIHEAFGEAVAAGSVETSTVDANYIRGIKMNHDLIVAPRKDLGLIQEERDKEVEEAEIVDSEDEKVLKVVTSSLEEILEKDKVEYVTKEETQAILQEAIKEETENLSPLAAQVTEYESTDETKETSITDGCVERTEAVSLDIEETTGPSAESTNEIKETSLTTDRSSLSFDPAIPIVPELNLDSLADLTISSFNLNSTDEENKDEQDKKKSKGSSLSEISLSSDSTKDLSADKKAEDKSLSVVDIQKSELQSNVTTEKSQESKEGVKDLKADQKESELQSSATTEKSQESKETVKEIKVDQKESEIQSNKIVEKSQESKETVKEIKLDQKESEMQSNKIVEKSQESKETVKEIKLDQKESEMQSNKIVEKSQENKESAKDLKVDQKESEIQSSVTTEKSQESKESEKEQKVDQKESELQSSITTEKSQENKESMTEVKEDKKDSSIQSSVSKEKIQENVAELNVDQKQKELQSSITIDKTQENKESKVKEIKADQKESEIQSSVTTEKNQESKESVKELKVDPKESELQSNMTTDKIQENKESLKEIKVEQKDSQIQSSKTLEKSEENKESPKELKVDDKDHKEGELQSIKTLEKSQERKENIKDIKVEHKETEIKSSQALEKSHTIQEKIEGMTKEVSNDEFKLVEEFQEEYVERVETEEYEKLEKIVSSTSSSEIKSAETSTKTLMITNENIQTSARDASLAGSSTRSDLGINKSADVVPDDINNVVCDKSESHKQISESALASENNARARQAVDAKSSSLPGAEESRLGVADLSGQLPGSSSLQSQCTAEARRLDPDDLSIKTNADDAVELRNNQSQDADAVRDEPTITEKPNDRAGSRSSKSDVVTEGRSDKLEDEAEEKKHYHVYVPEMSTSRERSSTSGSSTFNSAVTKIQAGVRGFLTRRRLQSSQLRSSTLDSVPSIQESFAAESPPISAEPSSSASTTQNQPSTTHLTPITEPALAAGLSDPNARKKLRREDAVQRTTLSVENAFAESQLQHTGEFHDCIPLPVFDARALSLKVPPSTIKRETSSTPSPSVAQDKLSEASSGPNVEDLLSKILLGSAAAAGFAAAAPPKLSPFVDVVLLPGDSELQNRYLNFITSVEDVNELFAEPSDSSTPKGVIIEEITSLDETTRSNPLPSDTSITSSNATSEDVAKDTSTNKSSVSKELPHEDSSTEKTGKLEAKRSARQVTSDVEDESIKAGQSPRSEIPEETLSLAEASITTSDEPLSMNIDEVLGLGDEDESLRRSKGVKKLSATDILRSGSGSRESHLSDERTRSPVTMMQIVPGGSGEGKKTKSELAAEVDRLSVKEDENSEEKEQESPSGKKSNDDDASKR